jgi:hypothetical protein
MEHRVHGASGRGGVDLIEEGDLVEGLSFLAQVLGALQHQQVPGDAVMTAEAHNAGTRLPGQVVVLVDHFAYPIRLSGDVTVVRSLTSTALHQQVAVLVKGTSRSQNTHGLLIHRIKGR